MNIRITRQSVCMGDDVEDHTINYEISSDSTFTKIFFDLIEQKYFPNVSGNDVVWTLMTNNRGVKVERKTLSTIEFKSAEADKGYKDDLVTWKTKENKIYTRFVTQEPRILSAKGWKHIDIIHFAYYSPPIKRAKYIFELHCGQKFHIWHEGFMSEYESYHISEGTEKDWSEGR